MTAETGSKFEPVAPPPYPESRNLLAGKSVLVTAAAGSGIGFATAKP